MSDTDGRFKSPKDRRKAAPVKRVALSEESRQAYADLANQRAQHEEKFGRHLSDKDKGKR